MNELEKYRAFHQRIRQRKANIPGELEALRQAGKEKNNAIQGSSWQRN